MVTQLSAVWRFRHFLLSLVRLDLKNRYTRSAIGVGWTVIQPLVMAGVFVLIFSGILGMSPGRYVTSLLLGLAVWNFVRESLVAGSNAFLDHERYIRQSLLPYALYPLRPVLGSAVHAGIALLVAVAAVVFVDGGFEKLAVFPVVLPALVLLLVAGWAAATLFAFAQCYFQDTRHLLDIGCQMLFFLTPIIYPPEVLVDKGAGWLARVNPVNLFLELIRTPLANGTVPELKLYVYAAAFTAGLGFLAMLAIRRGHRRLVYQL
ncbi:ABC transporter permease [Urbifossiella limnaea]|uniref:Transport permease protein n=1 Tax=Urbifossiella limnaea TaxID=2528023 RepID=A0A517XQX2_9BACT|nr:ABC transporter permease [Urbifossiella limnaea]QDU19914.1 ABC-2 type transporter [Urbifossiella limnaea]